MSHELIKKMYWGMKNLPYQMKFNKKAKKRAKGFVEEKYKWLLDYKNRFENGRCFIVATGPSLTMDDVNLLQNEVTFVMNSFVKIIPQMSWKPTFYAIQDKQVYQKLENEIQQMDTKILKILADELEKTYILPKDACLFPYNGNYHLYQSGKYKCKVSGNAYSQVFDCFSITHSLIQIAIYMGFKQIYLIGCDCNYSGSKKHFIESGFVDPNADKNYIRMTKGYEAIKDFCDSIGVEVINCTRGGMLEVFERKQLEDVL